VEVFLRNKADWWVTDFRYTVTQSPIQLASIVMTPMWGRMMGSTVNGGWKNYRMVGEHMSMHNTSLFK
jgi:hypothetical protein